MDTNKIIARAKSTLLNPRTEWPVIAAEPETVRHLYSNYILIMAAIPAVSLFLSSAVFGVSVPFLGTYRIGFGTGLTTALTTYLLGLVGLYLMALIVDALAPSFGGQKDRVQALKAVSYAYTASWVASIVGLVPGLRLLATIVGIVYSIYLLRLGLPFTMKCPDEKAAGYTAVSFVVAIAIGIVLNLTVGRLMRSTLYDPTGATTLSRADEGFTKGSTGAALETWAKNVEAASRKMDAAQKSGDANAQSQAMGQMVGAALGGDGNVESLAPEQIKSFIPESLAGLARKSISAERNAALGVQISKANARYSDGLQRNLDLEITDTGSLHGLTGLATRWAGLEQDKQTDTGYEKTYKSGQQLVHEQWDNQSHHGEYTVVVGDRFAVSVSGGAADMGELKSAVGTIDLARLEALRGVGMKTQ